MTTIETSKKIQKIPSKHFEDPDKTFFYMKPNTKVSFKAPNGSQISKISFSDVSFQEAENFSSASFKTEIADLKLFTIDSDDEEDEHDLEAGKKSETRPREIFVVVELEAEKNRRPPVCDFEGCKQGGQEFVNDGGILTWYCKDHYFTVKS